MIPRKEEQMIKSCTNTGTFVITASDVRHVTAMTTKEITEILAVAQQRNRKG
jgi:hypothetical protein